MSMFFYYVLCKDEPGLCKHCGSKCHLGLNIKCWNVFVFTLLVFCFVETGNTSSCKDHTEHSQDNDSENVSNLRLHFSAKSAPNSIFSSPVTSPRRSSNVDFYDPSIIFPQDFNDILRVSPAKTAQSPDRTPLRSPGSLLNPEGCQSQLHKHSSRVLPENNHVDAHPLPLPPRASPPPAQSSPQHQPSILHLTVENSPSMKGQWQKGKLIGRGSYGSVYHATNLYVLHLYFRCLHGRFYIVVTSQSLFHL